MRIKKLTIENWRGFLGIHTIEFSTNTKKPITVLIGENQTGKSDILRAIYWVLYDAIPEGSSDPDNKINDFAEFKMDGEQKAEVKLQIINDDNEEYEITRVLRKENTPSEFILRLYDSHSKTWKPQTAQMRSHNWIEENILPSHLKHIFLFRGESLIESFKDKDEGKLKEAINNLTGVNYLKESALWLDEFIKDKNLELTKLENKTKGGDKNRLLLEAAQEKEINLNNHIKTLRAEHKELDDQKIRLGKLMGKSKDEAIKDAINKITKLEPQKERLQADLEQKEEVLNKLIGEFAFDCFATSKISADDLVDKKGQDEVLFPGFKDPHREEALKDLLKSGECICGRALKKGDGCYEKIQDAAKVAITDEEEKGSHAINNLLAKKELALKTFDEKNETLEDDVQRIESDIKSIEHEISIHNDTINNNEELTFEERENKRKRDEVLKRMGDIEEELVRSYGDKREIENEIKELKKKVPQTTSGGDIDELNEIIFAAAGLANRLKIYVHNAEEDTKKELEEELQQLMKYTTTGAKFQFKDSSYIPQIISPATGRENPMSEGGNAMKSLFFGTSLVRRALGRKNIDSFVEPGALFPFVCDAPFSDLDDCNEKNAAELVLTIGCQTILLVNPSAFESGVEEKLSELKVEGKRYFIERNLTTGSGEKVSKRKYKIGSDTYIPFIENQKFEGSTIREAKI